MLDVENNHGYVQAQYIKIRPIELMTPRNGVKCDISPNFI